MHVLSYVMNTSNPYIHTQRKEFLQSIATAESTRETTLIFTDQQSSNEIGSSTAKEYANAAARRGSAFVSVILTCEAQENFRRATDTDRANGTTTKLTDLRIIRTIREQEDIFHFGTDMEMELDVTDLSVAEASRKVFEHVCKCVPEL